MPLCRSLSDHVYDSRESWGFSSGILSRCRCKHARHMQCKYYIAGRQTELRTVSIKEGSAEWWRVCTVKARVLGSLQALLDSCIRLLRRPIYAEPVGDSASCSIVRSASYSLGPFIANAEMMVDFIHRTPYTAPLSTSATNAEFGATLNCSKEPNLTRRQHIMGGNIIQDRNQMPKRFTIENV